MFSGADAQPLLKLRSESIVLVESRTIDDAITKHGKDLGTIQSRQIRVFTAHPVSIDLNLLAKSTVRSIRRPEA